MAAINMKSTGTNVLAPNSTGPDSIADTYSLCNQPRRAMPCTDQDDLQQLLTDFNAAALGYGDPAAGANLLAAMACTLANLAPADGTVVTRSGRLARPEPPPRRPL